MGHILANPISPDTLLGNYGLLGLAIILFAECGLLIGFFLPGDTLLLAAGIALSVGTIHTSLAAFLVVAPIAAILGNLVGYGIGYRAGPVVFDRPDSTLFKPEYVTRAQRFFDRWGVLAVLIGRFVAIVRTFVTVMAGAGRMRFSLYAITTVVGAIIWADGVLLLGYALGHVQFVRDHKGWLDYIIVAIVIVSVVPTAIHYVRATREKRRVSRSG